MQMKQKNLKLNYIYNLAYEILLLITPLVTTPYLSRVLKAEGIGSVSFAESIVAYFVLVAGLGTARLGQREISYVQTDKDKRSRVFWNLFLIRMVSTAICVIGYMSFVMIYGKNTLMFTIMVVNVLAVMFDVTWVLQGIEEFGKIVGRNFVFKMLNIIYIFVFVKTENDVIIYVIGLVLVNILSNISLWIYIPKYIGKFKRSYLQIKPFLRGAIALFIPTVAIQIYTVLDKTMIGIFTIGSTQNGYYEQAIRISKMVLTLITALGTVMIPRIGFHLGQKNYERVRYYMYRGYRFVWFLGIPLCVGLIGISDNMVPWFFGPGNEPIKLLLKILSLLIIAIGISNVTGNQYLIPTRKQRTFTITIVIGAIINFCINLILIPKFFALGAAIASVIAETAIAVVQLIAVRREFSIWNIVKSSFKYFIAGIIMLVVLEIENYYFSSSIFNTGIMILSGMAIYFVLIIIMKDDFLFEYIRLYKNKIEKIFPKKK